MGPARKEKKWVVSYTPPPRTFTTVARTASSTLKRVFTAAPKVLQWVKPGFISSIVLSGELGDTGPQAELHDQQCPSGIRVKQKARRWESSVSCCSFKHAQKNFLTCSRISLCYHLSRIVGAIWTPCWLWKDEDDYGARACVECVRSGQPNIAVGTVQHIMLCVLSVF